MTWQLYQLKYELGSPLHIGYHRIGNLRRTRYYVPARNVWGAVTEALTRHGFAVDDAPQGDYEAIGNWVQEHCAFGYWFVCEGETPLYPCYANGELSYGSLGVHAFERRYLSSHVTTALDAATFAAESLHEVEFIAPHTKIVGWVFLDDAGVSKLGAGNWQTWLGDLQIGGERRYGFGQLRLKGNVEQTDKLNEYTVDVNGARPRVQVKKDGALLAHTLVSGVEARGQIEPLVGRETKTSAQFSAKLKSAQICWTPGSLVTAETTVEITTLGTWKQVEG